MKSVFFASVALDFVSGAQASTAQAHDPLAFKITAPWTGFLGLTSGHSECSCNFDRSGSCGCDATLQFMDCIARACENPRCDCQGSSHFLGACHQISGECPHAGLQCFAGHAKCVVPTSAENDDDGDDRENASEAEPVMSTEAVSESQRLPKLHAEEERVEKLEEEISKEEAAEQEEKAAKAEEAAKDDKEDTGAEEAKEQIALEDQEPAPGSMARRPVDEGAEEAKEQIALEDQEKAPGSIDRRPVDEGGAKGVGSPMGSSSAMWGAAGNPKDWLALAAIQFAIITLAAGTYNRFRLGNVFPQTAKAAESQTAGGFAHSLFSCHQDPKLSFFALACPCLRWADTLEKANTKSILPYFVGAFLFAALLLLDPITAGVSLFVLVLVATYFRQKLRAEFSLQDGGRTIWEDFLAYFCCFCCAIVQEARHVEKSRANVC